MALTLLQGQPFLLKGQPRVIGEKTLVPVALVASLRRGPKLDLSWARPLAFRERGPKGDILIPLLPLMGAERRLVLEPGSMLKDMVDRLKSSASVDVVFGQTREVQGKAIIPVASIRYAFGAGGGEGTGSAAGEGQPLPAGSGGGGGGMVRAKPVAVLEVTPEETRVLPVMDYSQLASMALGGFLLFWFLRTLRRKK